MTDHERDNAIMSIQSDIAVIKHRLTHGSETFVTRLQCMAQHSMNLTSLCKLAIFAAVSALSGAAGAAAFVRFTNGG
jgi:hypothetical protein